VAKRADVLVARRRLGFGAEGQREHFVVIQSELLVAIETAVVAPLDQDSPLYEGDPLVVRVTGKEAGTKMAQAVLVHLLAAISLHKFEPTPGGRLSPKSMAKVEHVLRIVLQL